MGRVNIKAVALGIAADIGATLLGSMLLLSWYVGDALAPDMPPEDAERAMQQLAQDGGFLFVSLLLGLGFTALGGYVAARVAGKDLYLHAGLVGVASLLLGLFAGGGGPIWFNIAGLVLVVPAALYGGSFADRQINTNR